MKSAILAFPIRTPLALLSNSLIKTDSGRLELPPKTSKPFFFRFLVLLTVDTFSPHRLENSILKNILSVHEKRKSGDNGLIDLTRHGSNLVTWEGKQKSTMRDVSPREKTPSPSSAVHRQVA